MKNILLIVSFIGMVFFCGCDDPYYQLNTEGNITTIRIDDEGDYHFTTDKESFHDIPYHQMEIERSNVTTPILKMYYHKCPDGKTCEVATNEWTRDNTREFVVILPIDYKIDVFSD